MQINIPYIPSWLKNKYTIVLVLALIWLLFFDQNNLIQQIRLQKQLMDFKAEKEYYIEQIKKDSMNLELLKYDKDALEKYAREMYLMKRKNEDIFIIENE